MSGMRSIVATLVGLLIVMVTFWIGAVIAEISLHGIQLNSPGGPPTTADLIAHLAIGAAAAFCGTAIAVRVAQRSPVWHAGAVTLVLAVIAILGYGTATSHWPPWFGFAMAAAFAGGALAAALSPGAATTSG
jgi:hypothetical protein